MQWAEEKYGWLHSPQAYISLKNETDKVIVFERAGLLWIFNFHPSSSFTDYRVGVEEAGTYRIVLNTDSVAFGGLGRVQEVGGRFFTTDFAWNGRRNFLAGLCAESECVGFGEGGDVGVGGGSRMLGWGEVVRRMRCCGNLLTCLELGGIGRCILVDWAGAGWFPFFFGISIVLLGAGRTKEQILIFTICEALRPLI